MNIEFFWELCALQVDRSFSNTARSLNITQSTLSKHLAAAEKELGTTLVERTSGSSNIELTPSGKFVAEKGIDILNIWNEININLTKYRTKRNVVKIGVDNDIAFLKTMLAVDKLVAAQYPNTEISWLTDLKQTPWDCINNNLVDMFFAITDPLWVQLDELEIIPLFTDPAVLLVHEQDALAKKDMISISDLKDVVLINRGTPDSVGPGWTTHTICNIEGFAPKLKTIYSIGSDVLMYNLHIKPGQVAIIPEACAPSLRALLPSVCAIPFADKSACFKMSMVYSKQQSSELKEFSQTIIDFLTASC